MESLGVPEQDLLASKQHIICRCNSTVRISAFQADYKGSIPFTDSMKNVNIFVRLGKDFDGSWVIVEDNETHLYVYALVGYVHMMNIGVKGLFKILNDLQEMLINHIASFN